VRRINRALVAADYPLARPASRREQALSEHAAILAAIQTRDPAAARAAMSARLDTVEHYVRAHARHVARTA
jgi:DNA-binding FadR family transcriptional regulator